MPSSVKGRKSNLEMIWKINCECSSMIMYLLLTTVHLFRVLMKWIDKLVDELILTHYFDECFL